MAKEISKEELEQRKIIAANIKKYLLESPFNQTTLAEKVGISKSTMSDYLNLRSKPSHGVLQKIADTFNIGKSDIDTTYKESTPTNDNLSLLAAHIDDDATEEEIQDILDYIEFKKKTRK
ncbi:hypothetical protein RD055328_08750 [Companilactobacillus sp. RD055328]|uniref:helix-turn-helix domain-containing protein n=1 Tax=Companilactobacillus sp. RD055328 TaxID=2916634 RepID=UPI001FC8CA8A|nr:helix-turn-helix transcriptional regulator [Companilactobacillus sp. RD055328]GKQ42952.1 hypothetical protein RD055328_08750 [Companilactobacillus sp. RD055328]